tara:strand:- start:8242 stop:8457 length:216 start_codon:yes stop_codon:yes gene_type:complete
MTEDQIKALVVGPEDTLFVIFRDIDQEHLSAIGSSIFKTRPELKGRVFIMNGEEAEFALVKGGAKDVKSDT